MYLGVHDLDLLSEVSRQSFLVQKIVVHPDWSSLASTYDADISLIILRNRVNFNSFIKPICLWNFDFYPKIADGIVAGYGRSEDLSKTHENIAKKLQVPIYTNQKCYENNNQFERIISGRTFCGGTGDGSGVCFLDSGAGFYIKYNNNLYLRGIVS